MEEAEAEGDSAGEEEADEETETEGDSRAEVEAEGEAEALALAEGVLSLLEGSSAPTVGSNGKAKNKQNAARKTGRIEAGMVA